MDNPCRSKPLAFHLTWTTYGTWLPGDPRGWVKRGQGLQPPSLLRQRDTELRMSEDACRLDALQRRLVEAIVAEHCRIRDWRLYGVNCRSNHIHVVVTADAEPETVLEQRKSWTTRWLKELESLRFPDLAVAREHWWTERGSRRWINDLDVLEAVLHYVRECQARRPGDS